MTMQSIKEELTDHLITAVNDGVINEDNFEDAHHHAFNEDYYIIGYYNAEEWLKKHEMSAFKAISLCIEYEKETSGEVTTSYDNAEVVVNLLAYILSRDIVPSSDSWGDFIEEIEAIV